ncbi:MAG: serine/threonine protein kinase, partial [Planctomycetes bacterium]|nr:serine/threonine protein kinase [Planctomycetota bacterium]
EDENEYDYEYEYDVEHEFEYECEGEGEDESVSDIEEAREFFRLQEQRLSESGMLPAVEERAGEEEETFSPEEARRLLWETEEMKQPVIGYKILEKLGGGGSGAVFKALQMATKTEVALKLLYPELHDDPKSLQEFVREGVTLIKINHPNILRGIDFGFSKGFYFMVLEFVEGHSIAHFIESGKRTREAEAARIAAQILGALDYLAQKGIVHRDVKPGNILIVDRKVAKLCDFGLCLDRKRLDQKKEQEETTCGTVEYISPEQALGRTDLDVRSDLYSLGASLFQMISGHLPFNGPTGRDIMEKHIKLPVDFTGYETLFSQPMRQVLLKMMAKERDGRYESAKAALADLDAIYGLKGGP